MDLLTALHISSTGLTAQRMTMNIISTNLANVNTTRTPQGTPYRRKIAIMEAKPVEDFDSVLSSQAEGLRSVQVGSIVEDTTPFKQVYSPGHPDADEMGYVSFPNVNVVVETAGIMLARRAFEANVTAIAATKRMALKALEIGK